MKKVKDLKKWIELYNEVKAAVDEVQLAYEYVKEGFGRRTGRELPESRFADRKPRIPQYAARRSRPDELRAED